MSRIDVRLFSVGVDLEQEDRLQLTMWVDQVPDDQAPLFNAMAMTLRGMHRHDLAQIAMVLKGWESIANDAERERDDRTAALAEAITVIRQAGISIDALVVRLTAVEAWQQQAEATRNELIASNDARLQAIERAQADARMTQRIILALVFAIVLRSTYVVVDSVWGALAALVVMSCEVVVAIYYVASTLYLRKRKI